MRTNYCPKEDFRAPWYSVVVGQRGDDAYARRAVVESLTYRQLSSSMLAMCRLAWCDSSFSLSTYCARYAIVRQMSRLNMQG